MSKILLINMNYNMSEEELSRSSIEVAHSIAEVKGLKWKIWPLNAEDKSCGGIYLFEDEASVMAYLESDIITGLKSSPLLSNISFKVFDVLSELSKVTRAPL